MKISKLPSVLSTKSHWVPETSLRPGSYTLTWSRKIKLDQPQGLIYINKPLRKTFFPKRYSQYEHFLLAPRLYKLLLLKRPLLCPWKWKMPEDSQHPMCYGFPFEAWWYLSDQWPKECKTVMKFCNLCSYSWFSAPAKRWEGIHILGLDTRLG